MDLDGERRGASLLQYRVGTQDEARAEATGSRVLRCVKYARYDARWPAAKRILLVMLCYGLSYVCVPQCFSRDRLRGDSGVAEDWPSAYQQPARTGWLSACVLDGGPLSFGGTVPSGATARWC